MAARLRVMKQDPKGGVGLEGQRLEAQQRQDHLFLAEVLEQGPPSQALQVQISPSSLTIFAMVHACALHAA